MKKIEGRRLTYQIQDPTRWLKVISSSDILLLFILLCVPSILVLFFFSICCCWFIVRDVFSIPLCVMACAFPNRCCVLRWRVKTLWICDALRCWWRGVKDGSWVLPVHCVSVEDDFAFVHSDEIQGASACYYQLQKSPGMLLSNSLFNSFWIPCYSFSFFCVVLLEFLFCGSCEGFWRGKLEVWFCSGS